MGDIRAIPTIYRNCRFRSRLEARYAVILDQLGIQWKYEDEGCEIKVGPGVWIRYLPDFTLKFPEEKRAGRTPSTLYLEVKGQMSLDDAIKVKAFANTGRAIYVAGAIPENLRSLWEAHDDFNSYGVPLFGFDLVDGDGYPAALGVTKDGKTGLFGPEWWDDEGMDYERTEVAYAMGRMAHFEFNA